MSDMEGLEYLQPGFQPAALTVPRLRSILVAHNVSFPSNAKKAQLVELFNDQIIPQSKKILAARQRAKRSSKGIFDADSQSSGNPFEEQEELAPPTHNTRRSRSPRKASSTQIKSEEPDYLPMPPPAPPSRSASKPKRQQSSRASSRQLQASDNETGSEMDGPTSRRSRRAEDPPQIKTEDSDGLFRRTSDVFTRDNPFQGGGSPPVEKTPNTRRKTPARASTRSASGTGTVRRRAPVPSYAEPEDSEDYGGEAPKLSNSFETPIAAIPKVSDSFQTPMAAVPKVSNSFQTPMAAVPRYETPEPPMVEAGEEFTPQEQLELDAEEAASGDTAVMPARQVGPVRKSGWGTPVSGLLFLVFGLYAAWWRQEKMAVGYCGVGRPYSSIPTEIEVPDWVPEWAQNALPPQITVPQSLIDTVEPQCEPCPPHATCYRDFSVSCEQDYILQPHPLSLGGALPLPPTCEPDGEKVRRVQAVADKAVEELRERTAQYECGLPDEQGEKVESPVIEEQKLKQIINQKRSKKLNNQEFEDLWASAIGEIKGREEVEVEVEVVQPETDTPAFPNTRLASTSLARVPLTCAVRRSIRLGLARYRLQIGLVITTILTALYGRARLRANRAAAAQVPALVDLVLERLASQKQLAAEQGDDAYDDPWLFLPNLRDDVLRSIHSLAAREKIWQRVRAVVEQNSNVRTSQREGRSGEVGRAWEWIGPLQIAGDSAGRSRSRIGGRTSFYGSEEGTPAGDRSHLHQKWEEGGGRAVY
ncbi:Man1-Src1p-C-terminal domain-containing protein [Xylariomycetidae sp. FL0641]|nr:Man1-Src1p-C-terminal domain-containing protein [Xylariomycetidae sp. FL0641]